MTLNAVVQGGLYVALLIAFAWPLGAFMARVYDGKPTPLDRLLGPIERLLYRLAGVKPEAEMKWTAYAAAMLVFNFLGLIAVYALQRLQCAFISAGGRTYTTWPDSLMTRLMSSR